MARAAGKKRADDAGLTYRGIMSRASWSPLPAVTALVGTADFLKGRIVDRFIRELFGEGAPEVRRYQGPANDRQLGELPLATVLDELRTPSFFSPHRLVVIDPANAFVAAYAEDLLPFVEAGFAGGHLILRIDGKLDRRTRFAKKLAEAGWIVDCAQPFDRPPPWDTRSPVWDSELSHWVVAQAKEKGLRIDPETAYVLHERAGKDLAVLDEELEKMSTYLTSKSSRTIDADVIRAVVGDLHEDTVFATIELFLERKRPETLEALERMFRRGVATDKATVVQDPMTIALLFIGALLPRLRSLRRAHAMAARGEGPDSWIAEGLVQRPFLLRFQRELAATSPGRIAHVLRRLYEVDKAIKTGASPARQIELLVLECG